MPDIRSAGPVYAHRFAEVNRSRTNGPSALLEKDDGSIAKFALWHLRFGSWRVFHEESLPD